MLLTLTTQKKVGERHLVHRRIKRWSSRHKTHSFTTFFISQGSVVTRLRCDGNFNNSFIANSVPSLSIKESLKSVNIWRRYGQKSGGTFLWTTMYNSPSPIPVHKYLLDTYVNATNNMNVFYMQKVHKKCQSTCHSYNVCIITSVLHISELDNTAHSFVRIQSHLLQCLQFHRKRGSLKVTNNSASP